jgi:phenylalanyl-tRNA synthetase alpha chain
LDLRAIIDGLSTPSKKVLLALKQFREADVVDIAAEAGLDQAAVMRAALTLAQHGLARMSELKLSVAELTSEGKEYARRGLPERRMLEALAKVGPDPASVIAERAGVTREQAYISLGWLRQKGWAEFTTRADRTVLAMTKAGEEALAHKFSDEVLLEKLAAKRMSVDEIQAELKDVLEKLVERKLVDVDEKIQRKLKLTELGEEALALGIEIREEVTELTHELLVSGGWRNVEFRRYDINIPGAPVYPAKVHPQQQVIDELREILLEMGFVEIKSLLVESEFWNFDALFQAQDHPAREIHDSLSLSKPERAKLPAALLKRVAEAHEVGVAGSKGWGYKFNPEISARPVMCSQTTAATVRYLATKPKPPVKIFCIDRVYRHEKVDYKHLAEFYQAEGIVMAPKLTLRDMLGYLKQILLKMGLQKIRFRPGFFPYTEPSVEADGYFPEKGEWVELLGSGMFRPELLRPLGIRYPVLAWGIGLSRLMMIKLGIEDIRDLFGNDLERLSKRRLI